MSDREFDAFIETCNKQLDQKQSALESKYRLGKLARWDYDQNSGLLTFKDAKGIASVEAATTNIGSYMPSKGTWCWAWANDTMDEEQQAKSIEIQSLCDATGYDIFVQASLKVDDAMAWELAAMGVHHLKSVGCYCAVAKDLSVFLSIDNIRFMKQ